MRDFCLYKSIAIMSFFLKVPLTFTFFLPKYPSCAPGTQSKCLRYLVFFLKEIIIPNYFIFTQQVAEMLKFHFGIGYYWCDG
jgi:hypothetical protein